jgi:hypothetical protein
MDGHVLRRRKPARWFTRSLMLCALFCTTAVSQAQTAAPGQNPPPARTPGKDETVGKGAKAASGGKTASRQAGKDAASQQNKARSEPSEAYKESVRQTVERRRARRARLLAQGGASTAVGGIVPWPMPPALIIRHTRDVHDDIGSFLFGLRY